MPPKILSTLCFIPDVLVYSEVAVRATANAVRLADLIPHLDQDREAIYPRFVPDHKMILHVDSLC